MDDLAWRWEGVVARMPSPVAMLPVMTDQNTCQHDWRVNPRKLLMSNPPQREIVCVNCGKKSTIFAEPLGRLASSNPHDWPKAFV
jgi:hypothetical protein